MMKFAWNDIPQLTKKQLLVASTNELKTMTIQGVSTTMYGLGAMGAQWMELPMDLKDQLKLSCIQHFTVHSLQNRQAISNILYSLGLIGAIWNDFSKELIRAFHTALMEHIPSMSLQEYCNVLYG